MALTYQNGSGNFEAASFIVNGDGAAITLNVPLNLEPFNVAFLSTKHPPSGVFVPTVISVGSDFYTVATIYTTTTFTVGLTIKNQTGGTPLPNGTQITIPVTFIYSGT